MAGLRTCLAKMQLAGYDGRAYRELRQKTVTQPPELTARLRRLRAVSLTIAILGLGLPCLSWRRTVAAANWLLNPWEQRIKRKYLRRARKRLATMPNLVRIGITGSYGKTSVKNILAQILGTRYRVVASPASFNTPMGFARTVNEHLTLDTEILLMEMGARHVGDIAEMCRLVHPDHGIITSIGECHLATFGDLETVAATKGELFAALPDDGLAVTDGDNPWCRGLRHQRLRLVFAADSPTYETPLLGAHQQKNIAMAVAIARELGLSDAEITAAVKKLTPTPHRLNKIVAPNGIIILDDSYNANPESATAALSVLGGMAGRKVVQTPGFVEQGENTAAAHETLARQIMAVADAVIIVGETNRAVLEPALANFTGAVLYAPTRDAAQKLYGRLLRAGDVLLLLNDLPEQY